MDRHSFIFNFKRWPWAVIIVLLCFLGAEWTSRSYADRIRSFSDRLLLTKRRYLYGEFSPDYDGLLMGDSRVIGVDARKLSNTLTAVRGGASFRVYNAALPVMGVRSYYFFLKNYLRHHPAPRVIFFSFAPMSLTDQWNIAADQEPMNTRIHRFTLFFSAADIWQGFHGRKLYDMMVADIELTSFLVSYRRMIRAYIEEPKRRKKTVVNLEEHCQFFSGGVQYGNGDPPSSEGALNSPVGRWRFTVFPDSKNWLDRFLRLARQNDIGVVVFHAPLINEIRDRRRQNGDERRYFDYLHGWLAGYPNVFLLDQRWEAMPRQKFNDGQHLNGDGYRLFNKQINRRLARFFGEHPGLLSETLSL